MLHQSTQSNGGFLRTERPCQGSAKPVPGGLLQGFLFSLRRLHHMVKRAGVLAFGRCRCESEFMGCITLGEVLNLSEFHH